MVPMDHTFLAWAGSVVLAYLLGAFPTAYLVARWLRGIDVRRVGSGNAGALNVYRQLGWRAAAPVLLVDAAKGAAAASLARLLGAPEEALYLAAVVAVVGHNWSLFLGFSGGKGVAPALGALLVLLPLLTAVVVPPAVLVMVALRSAVLGFATGFLLLDALALATGQPLGLVLTCLALTLLTAATHFGRAAPTILRLLREGRWREITQVE